MSACDRCGVDRVQCVDCATVRLDSGDSTVDLSHFTVSAGLDYGDPTAELECDRKACQWVAPATYSTLPELIAAAVQHEAEQHSD